MACMLFVATTSRTIGTTPPAWADGSQQIYATAMARTCQLWPAGQPPSEWNRTRANRVAGAGPVL